MIVHAEITPTELQKLIRKKQIQVAGNSNLKIYGTLQCSSGKRMKTENRVFFENADEAVKCGYRPCAKCLIEEYLYWKNNGVF